MTGSQSVYKYDNLIVMSCIIANWYLHGCNLAKHQYFLVSSTIVNQQRLKNTLWSCGVCKVSYYCLSKGLLTHFMNDVIDVTSS